MTSNFDEMIDRRNTASLKWDVEENELPMWVADMDFATAPCVLEAMKKRLNHGIFGYTVIPEQWKPAFRIRKPPLIGLTTIYKKSSQCQAQSRFAGL